MQAMSCVHVLFCCEPQMPPMQHSGGAGIQARAPRSLPVCKLHGPRGTSQLHSPWPNSLCLVRSFDPSHFIAIMARSLLREHGPVTLGLIDLLPLQGCRSPDLIPLQGCYWSSRPLPPQGCKSRDLIPLRGCYRSPRPLTSARVQVP